MNEVHEKINRDYHTSKYDHKKERKKKKGRKEELLFVLMDKSGFYFLLIILKNQTLFYPGTHNQDSCQL